MDRLIVSVRTQGEGRNVGHTHSRSTVVLWVICGMLAILKVFGCSGSIGGLLEISGDAVVIPSFVTKRGEF